MNVPIACLTAAALFGASMAKGDVAVQPIVEVSLSCVFDRACDVSSVGKVTPTCAEVDFDTTVSSKAGDGILTFTPPNGVSIPGMGLRFSKYEGTDYLAFAFSGASGASHLTVYPNGTAVWTGHFTLQDNVASSKFGRCKGAI